MAATPGQNQGNLGTLEERRVGGQQGFQTEGIRVRGRTGESEDLRSSLVAQQVKDLQLSLLWYGFDPWPENFFSFPFLCILFFFPLFFI